MPVSVAGCSLLVVRNFELLFYLANNKFPF